MKRISYADEHFSTSDVVADALLHYAMELARRGGSDVVTIPVLEHGGQRLAQLIVGPASQITALESDDAEQHFPDEQEALDDLQRRELALHPHAVAEMPEGGTGLTEYLDEV